MNLGATPSQENRRADPEPEADPSPLRGAPPSFNEFARGYREQHGLGARYSDIYRAYLDHCDALKEEATI